MVNFTLSIIRFIPALLITFVCVCVYAYIHFKAYGFRCLRVEVFLCPVFQWGEIIMQLLLHLFLSYTQTVPTNTCMTKTKKEHKPNMQNVTRLVNFSNPSLQWKRNFMCSNWHGYTAFPFPYRGKMHPENESWITNQQLFKQSNIGVQC